MEPCPITKHMPVGAFIVFIISFLIFIYLLIIDSKETKNERSSRESLWIALFFILLIACMAISGYCVVKSHNVKMSKKIDKNLNLMKEKFYGSLPEFKGNRIF